jgi:LacI family transcriptional regulator
MKDIAERLGLSQATVSHVLRGRHADFRISAGTAERVSQAAAQLGYRASALARNFKTHRSFSLALAVGDLTNPFWSGLAMGAQQEADLVWAHARGQPHSGDGREGAPRHRDAARAARRRRHPVAVASRRAISRGCGVRDSHSCSSIGRSRGVSVPSAVTDSVAGLRMAVDHLVDCGHRRIAYVGGPTETSTFRDRLRGYRLAMARHRLRPGPYAVAPSEPDVARDAAARLFRGRASATAVIAANFWLTVGTLRAAPDDIVVVGFDDLFIGDLLRRPVTTIVQPVGDLGRQSVRLLLEEIAKPGGARTVVLPPRLVVRGH